MVGEVEGDGIEPVQNLSKEIEGFGPGGESLSELTRDTPRRALRISIIMRR
jgi:hypothetical protein